MKTTRIALLNLIFFGATMSVPAANARTAHHVTAQPVNSTAPRAASVGYASYYADRYNGRKTATGERFSNSAYTAASNQLPLGSRVRVTNLDNNRSVVVRVNDRGPYVKGRSIDLSRRAARDIGMVHDGVAKVQITPISD